MGPLPPGGRITDAAFARRAFIAAGAAVTAAVVLLLLIQVTVPLILIFAGLLLSVFFRALAEPIHRATGMRMLSALLIVLGVIFGLAAVFVWVAGPSLVEQFEALQVAVPEAIGELRTRVARYEWGRMLLGQADPERLAESNGVIDRATGIASRTVGMVTGLLGGLLLVFFLGVFIAAEPGYYRRGLLRLFPAERRERAADVLDRMDETLRYWLLGRAASMAVVGVLVWVGLTVLGMPLALAFGLLAGLLDFIPYFGPILAAGPAVLVAFLEGPQQALYVAALYAAVQAIESYLVSPIIERKVVRLPPALTLGAQVVLAVAGGIVGAAFASPIVAAAMALVSATWLTRTRRDSGPTDEAAR